MARNAKPARRNIVALHARMRTGAGLHGNGRRPEADWVADWEYEVEVAAESEAQEGRLNTPRERRYNA